MKVKSEQSVGEEHYYNIDVGEYSRNTTYPGHEKAAIAAMTIDRRTGQLE